jgi:hypothetical protein
LILKPKSKLGHDQNSKLVQSGFNIYYIIQKTSTKTLTLTQL